MTIFTVDELLKRGWTPALISKLLGNPDTIKKTTTGQSLQCYLQNKVFRNEKSKQFQKHVKKISAPTSQLVASVEDAFRKFFTPDFKRKIVLHIGPTNSGKTYQALQKLLKAETGCYLAPLRLLALENFEFLNNQDVKTSLLTGEEKMIVEDATHLSSTVEMGDLTNEYDVAVIDEVQLITDSQRGGNWLRALMQLKAHEIHLCGDPAVKGLIQRLIQLTGDELEIVNYERKTPLKIIPQKLSLKDIQPGDALICFLEKSFRDFQPFEK